MVSSLLIASGLFYNENQSILQPCSKPLRGFAARTLTLKSAVFAKSSKAFHCSCLPHVTFFMSPEYSQLVPISEPLYLLPLPRPCHSLILLFIQTFIQISPINTNHTILNNLLPSVTLSSYPALVFITALISTKNNVACCLVCFLFCEDRDLTSHGHCCLVHMSMDSGASLPVFKSWFNLLTDLEADI